MKASPEVDVQIWLCQKWKLECCLCLLEPFQLFVGKRRSQKTSPWKNTLPIPLLSLSNMQQTGSSSLRMHLLVRESLPCPRTIPMPQNCQHYPLLISRSNHTDFPNSCRFKECFLTEWQNRKVTLYPNKHLPWPLLWELNTVKYNVLHSQVWSNRKKEK